MERLLLRLCRCKREPLSRESIEATGVMANQPMLTSSEDVFTDVDTCRCFDRSEALTASPIAPPIPEPMEGSFISTSCDLS